MTASQSRNSAHGIRWLSAGHGRARSDTQPSSQFVPQSTEFDPKSIGAAEPTKGKPAKRPRKVASGQKEMLMPIAGKKPAKEAAAKKPAAKAQGKSA